MKYKIIFITYIFIYLCILNIRKKNYFVLYAHCILNKKQLFQNNPNPIIFYICFQLNNMNIYIYIYG